jgi:nucleoid-associated protein YgaU
VKRTISIAAVTLLAAAGCQSNKTQPSASLQPTPAVTQVTTPAPVQAEPVEAVDTSTPAPTPMTDISTNSPDAVNASYTGGKYVVKAGDTLYRIAAKHYGEGKEWKKILAANAGISPTHLRVGQVLILP